MMDTTTAAQRQKAVQAWVKLPHKREAKLLPSPPSTARSPASEFPLSNESWGRAIFQVTKNRYVHFVRPDVPASSPNRRILTRAMKRPQGRCLRPRGERWKGIRAQPS